MATIAVEKAVNYTNTNHEGLWKRFKKYLAENQQTIAEGLSAVSGSSYYPQHDIMQEK